MSLLRRRSSASPVGLPLACLLGLVLLTSMVLFLPVSAAIASDGNGVATWTQLSPTTVPPARYDATMAYDAADGYTVLFGGVATSGATLDDTWVFQGGEWTHLNPATSPLPRAFAVMAYDAADGYVVLFGGDNAGGTLGDTWAFRGGQWTQLSPDTSPSPRTYAAMSYDSADGYVVLFGGTDPASNAYDQDTWVFSAGQWTQLLPSVSPAPRAGEGLADDQADGYVVLFGGSSNFQWSGAGLGDTWCFSAGQWGQLSPQSAPVVRDNFSFAYDAASQSAVLFGGWSPSLGRQVGDTWQFSAGSWTQVSSLLSPGGKQGAAVAYDPSVRGVMLFGGVAGGFGIQPTFYAETWVFAAPLPPDTTPPRTTVTGADDLWHDSDVDLTLEAADDPGGSGVAATYYQVDSGPWTEGTSLTVAGPADHSNDGVHTVSYYSTDNAGNTEATQSVTAKIDTTSPATAVSGADDFWHNGNVDLTLTASDPNLPDASGVDHSEYRLDAGSWVRGTSVTVAALADHSNDGVHTVDYRSVDIAGNTEATQSVTVKIDTTAPVISVGCLTHLCHRGRHCACGRGRCYASLTYRIDDNLSPTAAVTIEVLGCRVRILQTISLGQCPTGVYSPTAGTVGCRAAPNVS